VSMYGRVSWRWTSFPALSDREKVQIEFRRLRRSQATQTPTPNATKWSSLTLPANPDISLSLRMGSTEASVQCRRRPESF